MDKKLTELHGMLKTAEADLKKGASQVLMVQNKAKFKKSSWTKKKKAKSGGKTQDSVPSAASGLSHLLQLDPLASIARRMVTGRGTAASIWLTKPRVEVGLLTQVRLFVML